MSNCSWYEMVVEVRVIFMEGLKSCMSTLIVSGFIEAGGKIHDMPFEELQLIFTYTIQDLLSVFILHSVTGTVWVWLCSYSIWWSNCCTAPKRRCGMVCVVRWAEDGAFLSTSSGSYSGDSSISASKNTTVSKNQSQPPGGAHGVVCLLSLL